MDQAKLFQLMGFLTLVGLVQLIPISVDDEVMMKLEKGTVNSNGQMVEELTDFSGEEEIYDEFLVGTLPTPQERRVLICKGNNGMPCSTHMSHGGCSGNYKGGGAWCWTNHFLKQWDYCECKNKYPCNTSFPSALVPCG